MGPALCRVGCCVRHRDSLVMEPRLWRRGTPTSVVAARGLRCSAPWGIFVPWPGIERVSPALQRRFLTTGPSGKPYTVILFGRSLFPYIDRVVLRSKAIFCLFSLTHAVSEEVDKWAFNVIFTLCVLKLLQQSKHYTTLIL